MNIGNVATGEISSLNLLPMTLTQILEMMSVGKGSQHQLEPKEFVLSTYRHYYAASQLRHSLSPKFDQFGVSQYWPRDVTSSTRSSSVLPCRLSRSFLSTILPPPL